MIEKNKLNNIKQVASTLIGKGKHGEALNYLRKKHEANDEEIKIKKLVDHLDKILEYQHRDVFASMNLDMDPWFG